jgi:hypothetical protein
MSCVKSALFLGQPLWKRHNCPPIPKRSGGRLCHQSHSGLLDEVHPIYWDTAASIFDSVLHLFLSPDDQLRILTQWRRAPGALRKLDKDSMVLGLPIGTIIPQLVIHEKIRTRASRNSGDFLVPSDFRPTPIYRPKPRSKRAPQIQIEDQELLRRIQECCRDEWGGEYPKPATVRNDGREWVINFWNHADDKKPSTFVKGEYRQLVLNGRHSFETKFYLSDHMSADELCDSLTEAAYCQTDDASCLPSPEIAPFLTSEHQPKLNWIESQIDRIHSSLAEPIAETASDEIKRLIGSSSQLPFVRRGFSMLIWSSAGLKESGRQPGCSMNLRWKFSIWPCPFIRSSDLAVLRADPFPKPNQKHRSTGSQGNTETLLC